MDLIPDPVFIYHFTKHLAGVNRLWDYSPEQIENYQVKSLKKMIKYANKTVLYQKKFRKANLDINQIQKIEDIKKLPFVSKDDLRAHSPSEMLPNNSTEKDYYKVATSGSTGKPINIYRDDNAVALESTNIFRTLKTYGLHPFKTKVTHIGDFSIPDSYDEECINNGTFKKLGFLSNSSESNAQHLYAGDNITKIMEKMDLFKPDFIVSYPGTLLGLMELRKQGKAENINPKYVVVSGGVLDGYLKRQFENTFDTKVFNLYAATEGGTVAYECLHGNYHVQSDLVYVEAVDKNMETVGFGKHGHLVITRLYSGGTPILRYTGMDDIITLKDGKCDCGLNTQLLENVEGRTSDSIVLPDGRIFPPATFTLIPGEVSEESGYDIVQRFQIIQNKIDEINIFIVINNDFREKVKSVDDILNEIKKRYQLIVGEKVNVTIKEVDKVKEDKKSPTSLSSIVMSYVNHKEMF